jgi:hypothetical protein
MAAGKSLGSGAKDRTKVDERNMIGVSFGDLAEEDQHRIKEEMRRELEEIGVAKMKEKLACY